MSYTKGQYPGGRFSRFYRQEHSDIVPGSIEIVSREERNRREAQRRRRIIIRRQAMRQQWPYIVRRRQILTWPQEALTGWQDWMFPNTV